MITISVCNHKGGTGKTTSTSMLASAAGLSGHRVLVIDLDPQGFLTRLVGLPEPRPSDSSCVLFVEDGRADPLPTVAAAGFDIVPSSTRLTTELRRMTKPTDVFRVREALATRTDGYDLVMIDTAAALTVLSLNALVAADRVVIPVLPEYQPVVGAEQTWQTAQMVRDKLNPGLVDARFLLTMVDARKRDHHAYSAYLRERYGEGVLRSVVRTSASLAAGREGGRSPFESDPGSRGVIDYANAADELFVGLPAGTPSTA